MYKLYLNPIADGKYRSLPTVIPEFQHWVSRLYGYEPVTDALYPIVIFFWSSEHDETLTASNFSS